MAELRTWHTLTIDTGDENWSAQPDLVQNADYGFILNVRHLGVKIDLTEVRDVILISQPPKRGEVPVISKGTVSGESQVTVPIKRGEVAWPGVVKAQLKLLGTDGGTISTLRFEYQVQEDVDNGAVPSTEERTYFEDAVDKIYDSTASADRAAKEADAERSKLTGQVGQAIKTLNEDKEEVLTEVSSTISTLNEQKTAAIEQMQTETRSNIEALHTEKGQAIEQMEERTTTAIDTLNLEKGEAIQQLADVREANRINRLPAVETVAERDSRYPTPSQGDTVRVISEARTYSYEDGSWIITDANHPTAISEALSKLNDAGAAQTVLSEGTHVVKSPTDSPVGVEIRGTTLVSLGNSNLEKGKYYALTDEKYKVITDGKTVSGVGKFQKGETHYTLADFKGKVLGDLTSNPHRFFHIHFARKTFLPPFEGAESATSAITTRDSITHGSGSIAQTAGDIAQHNFAFDVIAQVERNLGVIPGDTRTEKAQWLKDNLASLRFNWYGFGSNNVGEGGTSYRANLAYWHAVNKTWTTGFGHDQPTSVHVPIHHSTGARFVLTDDGYSHLLAYSNPSDGAGYNYIYTDYVNLEITLNATAQLNTRPTIVRVENFEGKVAGSTVENPHIAKYSSAGKGTSVLRPDSPDLVEVVANRYGDLLSVDNSLFSLGRTTPGDSAQHMFSFNIIEAVERNIGRIPQSTISGKAKWLRDNLKELNFVWEGYGSGPSGHRANLALWMADRSEMRDLTFHTLNRVGPIRQKVIAFNIYISSDGYISGVVHAEKANETIASQLYSDYVSLEIELKPTADFLQPRVPLYEVPKTDYDRVGVTYTNEETKRRYPVVRGVQHLRNPYMANPGENLLPPFTDSRWQKTGVDVVVESLSPNEVTVGNTSLEWRGLVVDLPVVPNQTYRLEVEGGENTSFVVYDLTPAKVLNALFPWQRGVKSKTFTPKERMIRVRFDNGNMKTMETFRNPRLTLGTEPKPFTPHNPSALSAPVTLSTVGNRRDVLYQQDGRWYVRRTLREIELTGEQEWGIFNGLSGVGVREQFLISPAFDTRNTEFEAIKYTGAKLKNGTASPLDYVYRGSANLVFTVPSKDTGFPQNTNDITTASHVKRYFNGWKYVDGITWSSVTGNDQTATAEEALSTMPTDYTPYKLTYVLATPEVIDVTDLVEGDLIVSELAQITVGSEGQVNVQDAILTIQQSLRSAFDAVNTKLSDNVRDTLMLKRQMLEVLIRLDAVEGRVDVLEMSPEPVPEGGEV